VLLPELSFFLAAIGPSVYPFFFFYVLFRLVFFPVVGQRLFCFLGPFSIRVWFFAVFSVPHVGFLFFLATPPPSTPTPFVAGFFYITLFGDPCALSAGLFFLYSSDFLHGFPFSTLSSFLPLRRTVMLFRQFTDFLLLCCNRDRLFTVVFFSHMTRGGVLITTPNFFPVAGALSF